MSKDQEIQSLEELRVGVTTYENFYTDKEMKEMEHMIEETEKKSLASKFMLSLK